MSGYVIFAGALGLADRDDPKNPPILLANDTLRSRQTAATVSNPLLTERFLCGFMYRADMVRPEMVAALQEPMVRVGYTIAVSHWLPQLFATPRDAQSMDPAKWRAFQLSVALIWGDQDSVTPLAQSEEFAALIPGATLTVLKDVGQIPHLEAPDQFSEALQKALSTITRATQKDDMDQ